MASATSTLPAPPRRLSLALLALLLPCCRLAGPRRALAAGRWPPRRPARERPAVRAAWRPDWLPSESTLRDLAGGESPVCFFCLRQEGERGEALCTCEVGTGETSLRAFRFAGRAGEPEERREAARWIVRELDFSEGKLGGHLWDGGIWMAAWAASRARGGPLAAGGAEIFEGRRVLELGSGVGLLGVALAGVAGSVVLTDFGPGAAEASSDPARLIPPGLLRNLRSNVALNGIANAEVRHLDWHDFLARPGRPAAAPAERFELIAAADVVYYKADLAALAAATAAHLLPRGRAYVMVPGREWTGPLAGERATLEDLLAALAPFGSASSTALVAHCGSLEGSPAHLVEFVRSGE